MGLYRPAQIMQLRILKRKKKLFNCADKGLNNFNIQSVR